MSLLKYFIIVLFAFMLCCCIFLRLHERINIEKNTLNISIQSDSLYCDKTFYLVTVGGRNIIKDYSGKSFYTGSKRDTLMIKDGTFPDVYGRHSILIKLCDGKHVKVCGFTKTEYWKKYHVYITLKINKDEIIGYQEIKNYIDDVFASEKEIKGVRAKIVFKEKI